MKIIIKDSAIVPSTSKATKNRFAVIVGVNGVGKTRMLEDINSLITRRPRKSNNEIEISGDIKKCLYIKADKQRLFGETNRISEKAILNLKKNKYLPINPEEISSKILFNLSTIQNSEAFSFYEDYDVDFGTLWRENFGGVVSISRRDTKSVAEAYNAFVVHSTNVFKFFNLYKNDWGVELDKFLIRYKEFDLLKMKVHFQEMKDVWKSSKILHKYLPDFPEAMDVLLDNRNAFAESFQTRNAYRENYMKFEEWKNISILEKYGLVTSQISNRKLSSGESRMLDVLLSISTFISDNEKVEKIVLIDEVDLYLHPNWVYTLVATIDQLATDKKTGFILTTHNSLVLNAFEKKQVYIKDESSIKNPEFETFGKSNDFLLREIFNIENSSSSTFNKYRDKYFEKMMKDLENENL